MRIKASPLAASFHPRFPVTTPGEQRQLRLQHDPTFTLPRKFTLEISGNYDSPGYWGLAQWRVNGSLNVGLQIDFGEKWGKLRFNTSDLFQSTGWFGTTNQPEINLLVNSSFQIAERALVL